MKNHRNKNKRKMELNIIDKCLTCILVIQLAFNTCLAQNPVRDTNYFR